MDNVGLWLSVGYLVPTSSSPPKTIEPKNNSEDLRSFSSFPFLFCSFLSCSFLSSSSPFFSFSLLFFPFLLWIDKYSDLGRQDQKALACKYTWRQNGVRSARVEVWWNGVWQGAFWSMGRSSFWLSCFEYLRHSSSTESRDAHWVFLARHGRPMGSFGARGTHHARKWRRWALCCKSSLRVQISNSYLTAKNRFNLPLLI